MRNDIERILIDEAVILKRLDSMALEIERDFPGGKLVVIILLKGALVFAADLLRRVPRPLEIECLNVASYHGGMESSGKVDFLDRHFPEVKGSTPAARCMPFPRGCLRKARWWCIPPCC